MTPEQAAREITERFSAALEKTLQSSGASGYSLYAEVLKAIKEAEMRGQIREMQRWQRAIESIAPNPGCAGNFGTDQGTLAWVIATLQIKPAAEKP